MNPISVLMKHNKIPKHVQYNEDAMKAILGVAEVDGDNSIHRLMGASCIHIKITAPIIRDFGALLESAIVPLTHFYNDEYDLRSTRPDTLSLTDADERGFGVTVFMDREALSIAIRTATTTFDFYTDIDGIYVNDVEKKIMDAPVNMGYRINAINLTRLFLNRVAKNANLPTDAYDPSKFVLTANYAQPPLPLAANS